MRPDETINVETKTIEWALFADGVKISTHSSFSDAAITRDKVRAIPEQGGVIEIGRRMTTAVIKITEWETFA